MIFKKKKDWKKIVSLFLVLTLILSVIYSIVMIIISPEGANSTDNFEHFKSDYVLMLLQCSLGLLVMFLPTFIEKRWSIHIPDYMTILYFVFLYCAIFLGEVRNFYYVVPHWDTILHAISGAMLGAFGFLLVSILNDSKKTKVILSPFFVAIFAFSFALAIDAIWEIYEFTCDRLFQLNMQKYRLADGTLLIGNSALKDTMKDLIVDALSALIISVIGYFLIKKNTGKNSE